MPWLALLPSAACPTPPWPELACRLGRFTPQLMLRPEALLAELAGSLRLFGGLEALLAELGRDLAGFPLTQAVAATPRAAVWLARGDPGRVAPDLVATRAAVRALPVAALAPAPEAALRLAALGLRDIGAVLDLPRAGLALRLGAGFVAELGRGLGEIADPPAWYAFPARFEQGLELPAAVEAAPALLFAARRLIAALAGWLAVRQRAVRTLRWRIGHGRTAASELDLAFSRPVREAARIERVLAERLGRLRLPAPALDLALTAESTEAWGGRSGTLFGRDAGAEGDALAEVCDRLAARLGGGAVRRLDAHADHRPERATVAAGSKVGQPSPLIPLPEREREADSPSLPLRERGWERGTGGMQSPEWGRAEEAGWAPLWLAATPVPLGEEGGRPRYRRQPLRLLAGPERIESGWWDGGDIRRDYFIAADGESRWLWIFRQQGAAGGGWYLHGWFS